MIYLSILLLSIQVGFEIPKVEVEDGAILQAISSYVDSIDSSNRRPTISYHIMARLEQSPSGNRLYLSATCSMYDFKFGIPDRYSIQGSHLVFWFEQKKEAVDDESIRAFQKQFEGFLVKDILDDGSKDFLGTIHNDDYLAFQSFPICTVIKSGTIVDVRRVCRFPNSWFYRHGYKYDDNGDLMFEDGSYDPCALDHPIGHKVDEQDVTQYIATKAQIPENCLGYITAIITMNKSGKPNRVEIIMNGSRQIDPQARVRLENTILKMPRWSKATVRGKAVDYKVSLGL